jgi:predicted DNA-binding ribbon-helix-helix protein
MGKVRSIDVAGINIGVYLEDEFWDAFFDIAESQGVSSAHLMRDLKSKQAMANFSAEVRSFIVSYFIARTTAKAP